MFARVEVDTVAAVRLFARVRGDKGVAVECTNQIIKHLRTHRVVNDRMTLIFEVTGLTNENPTDPNANRRAQD